MNQPRQEYQLLQILSEQLKQSKDENKTKDAEWWLNKEESRKILEKIHEIKDNFHYQPPQSHQKKQIPSNTNNAGKEVPPQKKKINFQIR
jgi:hypothetical protein